MIENAKIIDTSLSMAEHGCLIFDLVLEGRGWACTYGGRCLGYGYVGSKDFSGSAKGLESIMRIMDVVGVATYEELKNKYIRVDNDGWGSHINKIGNLIEDKWFDYNKFFEEDKID